MYKAIGFARTRAMRVLWMLEEIGAEYEYINHRPGSPAMKEINPSGKAPALVVGDAILTDSCAIMDFLADRHGKLTYACGTIERAQQNALVHQINDEMDALLWTAARNTFVLPEDRRVPEVKETLKWEFARNADRIADQIKGEFLMGDMMTVPDILLCHCLNWAYAAGFPVENQKLRAYAKNLRQRDAYKRAFALED